MGKKEQDIINVEKAVSHKVVLHHVLLEWS